MEAKIENLKLHDFVILYSDKHKKKLVGKVADMQVRRLRKQNLQFRMER